MKRALLGAFLVLVIAPYAKGQSTGNELLAECEIASKDEVPQHADAAFKAGLCMGYLHGVSSTIRMDRAIHAAEKKSATSGETTLQSKREASVCSSIWLTCVPDEVTVGQLAKVIVKYLNEHPESLHKEAFFLVDSAFRNAFPCGRP